MATYYVWSGATGTNAGTSWTNAYTAFGSAVTAATAAGDVILVHYTHQEQLAVDTTYTFSASVRVISVNKDSSNAPTAMGTGGWIGNSTTNRNIFISGALLYFWGITLRVAGTGADSLSLARSDGSDVTYEDCYLWIGTTADNSSNINLCSANNSAIHLKNCTFRFGNVAQSIGINGGSNFLENCTISTSGSAPSTIFTGSSVTTPGQTLVAVGCNFAHGGSGTIVGGTEIPSLFQFVQCKFGASATALGSGGTANGSGASVYVFDCSSGDTHGLFGYYDAFGSCVSDTGIYYTTGAAAQSWKIVTTANCSFYTPFVSPFVDFYNTGTSSITPRFEILRDGSTTAFQDDEVWGEFFVKSTSGSTQSTPSSDRMALLGTPANQAAGAGTGSWTGEGANAWSGKIDSGSAVTPAESGHIRGRVVVGEPSITVYVDPQIRT